MPKLSGDIIIPLPMFLKTPSELILTILMAA
jgi:hypothetical protein